MANQNITTKETISQLNDADTLLVVQNSKLRRISKKNAYGDEVSRLNEDVSNIQNKLSIKATENAWAGSQLKFSLPKNNVKIYELTAISLVSDCVKTNFIIRADGTIIKKDFGYATTLSYDSNGILTVDFAKSTYWCYNLVEMSSNY